MKKMLYIILIVAILLIALILFLIGRNGANQSLEEEQVTPTTEPVILLIIDSLMDQPLQQAIQEGRAPALKFFMDKGNYYPNVVSSYPTMSVSIDSTLLTGKYPDEHRIPGLVWFNDQEKRLINYGSAKEEIFKVGIKHVIEDNFYHLNHTHLSSQIKTLHEEIAENGLQSGSINALVYRGTEKKKLNLSKTLSEFDLLPESFEIKAPHIFSYGAFAQYSPENKENTQLWERYGFNDKFVTEEIKYVIENSKLPAFTLLYLSNLDKEVHQDGPNNHIQAIEEVDKQLQEILNTYETWDMAIQDTIWMIMGDSGQAPVKEDKSESLISLHSLLQSYNIHKTKDEIKPDDELVFALNERMAYIYTLNQSIEFNQIAAHLQEDQRISFIAWKENNNVHVITSDKESELTFRPEGSLSDNYGQSWTINGDYSILDLNKDNNRLEYGSYPDALARLYSALHSHEGNFLVVDAKPGFEFIGEGTPTHPGGGSHGSLHESDAFVPLIVSGTDTRPEYFRIVDLKPWIKQLIMKDRQ
ncbi:alkaline phosphatase family protein [Ornithinibacillus salinisoli]|uniref:Alkaline phosphatase family protein n=1 Tax=Ornithinibacillus salinisoli TaxID=1848459 RepID=A0ABW4VYF5_9BACI